MRYVHTDHQKSLEDQFEAFRRFRKFNLVLNFNLGEGAGINLKKLYKEGYLNSISTTFQ
jgi:hypothetical protein